MMIEVAWAGGWDAEITEARVPDSIIGKMGRIQGGVTSSFAESVDVRTF